jgi:hypothetical protein
MRLFEDHIKQNNTESRKRNTRQYIIGHFKIKNFYLAYNGRSDECIVCFAVTSAVFKF